MSKQEAKPEVKEKTDQELHPEKYFIDPKGHPRDRIIIHDNPKMPREGAFVSLNGYGFLAKAGIEIDIPRPVRLMMDTRIETETTQDKDGRNYTRDIPRMTYTLIKEDVTGEFKIPEQETVGDQK